MHRLRTIVALVIFASLSPIAQAEDPPSPQELCDAVDAGELTTMQFEAAEQVLEADIDYRAILCSTAGAIYVDLYEELTPMTVNNFVFLAEQGYYDNTTFHRVIPDFMAQGGDPTGTGRGGPGYQFGDEPVSLSDFRSTRIVGDGERRSGHQRQPVLHHNCANAASQLQAYDLWRCAGGPGHWSRRYKSATQARRTSRARRCRQC